MPPSKNTRLRLSILDQCPIPEGSSAGEALRNTIDLARHADAWGYTRYWLAEHHGTPALACASPEALIGLVAGETARMRIGSGGVMLPHYSPLKVSETFSMLSELFPGRVDLGVGRAAGTSPNVALALQRDRRQRSPDDFYEQLIELLNYLSGDSPESWPGAQPWLLGSSIQSAIWAAELGLPYVFAGFINRDGAAVGQHYVNAFQPSNHLRSPSLGVAAWAICAETDEEAFRLSASLRMLMALMLRGRLIAVPRVERAERFLEQQDPLAGLAGAQRRIIAGSPTTVRAGIEQLASDYGAEEVLIVNIMHDHAARARSYELIADEFQLLAFADQSAASTLLQPV